MRTKPSRQQTTRDEDRRADHTRQQTLKQKDRRFRKKPCQRHQQRSHERAANQDMDCAPTVQHAGRDQGTHQIAHRVEGVHAAC